MLADEYILIVPFATQLHFGLTEYISAAYRNFNNSFSIGFDSGSPNAVHRKNI
jgi:hypothetical protein